VRKKKISKNSKLTKSRMQTKNTNRL